MNLSSRLSGASAARSLGVAYLVLDQVDKSIAAFEQAVELDPDDTRSRADLAAALVRRWRAGGHALSAVRALEETGFVLAKQPHSPEATFNQALILEYPGARAGAIARWEQFLRADTATPWASEARSHLDALKKTVDDSVLRSTVRTDADADQVAASDPFAAYNLVETELARWASATLAGGDGDVAFADRLASGRPCAGATRYLAELTRAARESTDLAGAAPGGRWPKAFAISAAPVIDRGHDKEAEPLGPRATAAFTAAASTRRKPRSRPATSTRPPSGRPRRWSGSRPWKHGRGQRASARGGSSRTTARARGDAGHESGRGAGTRSGRV